MADSLTVSFWCNYPIHNVCIRWGVQTEDTLDVKKAMEILDEDHYGMKDVKDRIIEFIAVSKLRLVFKRAHLIG